MLAGTAGLVTTVRWKFADIRVNLGREGLIVW